MIRASAERQVQVMVIRAPQLTRTVGTLLALLAAAAAMPSMARAATNCQQLTGRQFGAARIIETAELGRPAIVTSLQSPSSRGVSASAPFCRVRGQIRPTPESDIRFEVWLPDEAAWNGRYLGIGNGGNAGAADYQSMMSALGGGFAVSGTDTGHVGTSFESGFAIGHPEQVIDFGWRAIHETALASKAVIAAYYGKAASFAYFAGCSTGGRQGMAEASRFPDDYDGIAVGAPASNWPALNAMGAHHYKKLLANPDANWPSPHKLALVNAAVMKKCGGVDGLLDDPGACRFDPAVLLCRDGADTSTCLTRGELGTVQGLYAGLSDADGRLIYPGFTPGSENLWPLWRTGTAADKVRQSLSFSFNEGFFRDYVHQDPSWDLSRFDVAADLASANDGLVGAAVYAQNPDLTAFRNRGGKLLHYHGWDDPAIPPAWSIMYYESVAQTMGGSANLGSFYRLFLGTGMSHCGGGPGPSAVGGAGLPAPARDASHDVIAALRRWVEEKVAPSTIIASRYVDGDPAKEVDMQRPWCPYPQVATYVGAGDRKSAASYACRTSGVATSGDVLRR